MRVITANLNGIRSAAQKGFFTWLAAQDADVVCLQETKAQIHQLSDPVFSPEGYHCHYHDAEKKGYSGVAIYSRQEPLGVRAGLGIEDYDREGRYLEIALPEVNIVSIYLPSGTSGEERQAFKYRFLDDFYDHMTTLRERDGETILCGDWNIAHREIDLKNWKSNQKNSGFLPEERAWLDKLFGPGGYVDGFRVVNQEADQYTWWSNRGRAREKNVGWRLDYQILTPGLRDRVRAASIYTGEKFSDHAPLIMDYAL